MLKKPFVRMNNPSVSSGFTLIELMVVVVILSIFAGMMTLSVGSTESRKNHAFYEHLVDSLEYVRLLSAEQMQPMGLLLEANNQGQVQPVIVQLNNAYAPYQSNLSHSNSTQAANAMQLMAMRQDGEDMITPSWAVNSQITLPELPPDVSIDILPLGSSAASNQPNTPQLQPWFVGSNVPEALWFGTGEASPVHIEVRHNKRLIGDAIRLLPDGRIVAGKE